MVAGAAAVTVAAATSNTTTSTITTTRPWSEPPFYFCYYYQLSLIFFYLFQGVASCWIPTDSCRKIGFESKPHWLLCRSGADCLQSSPHDSRHWTQPRQNATGIWLRASSCKVMCHTEVVYLILSATMNILPLFNMVPIFLLNSDWMHIPPYKICNIIFSFHLNT